KPDQDSFSIAADPLNPEGLDFDGSESIITVHLADQFNNPVPDGTAVTLTTEGGAIVGSCLTGFLPSGQRPTETDDFQLDEGECAVIWNSANPRPIDGRVTVLATAIGNESFTDDNGNALFDSGEFDPQPFPRGDDLPGEALRDDNEDGDRDPGEPFLDFNSSLTYDPDGNGIYNGVLCPEGATDCTRQELNVRGSLVLVMSGSNAMITILSPTTIDLRDGPQTLLFTVSDVNGNPMPADTMINIDSNGTIRGPSEFIIPSTNVPGPSFFSVPLEADILSNVGTLSITVTTPLGVITQGPSPSVTVID
nr:Ig-like domain-containing protein [Pseudomonadota bacterium]